MRGPTARSLLRMHWEYPVWQPPAEEASGGTRSAAVRRALPREEALAYLAGDDPRPLLVLRECKECNGTDDALLKGGEENERTFLLATWFHCVKLPSDVLAEDHPFHALFLEPEPEHLFVSSVDGAGHAPLQSQTSRTELWKSMLVVLAGAYASETDKALRTLARLLDDLDAADDRLAQLASRRDALLEDEGPGSRKLAKLEREVAKAEAERRELLAAFDRAAALELRPRPAAAPPAEPAAPAREGPGG